MLTALHIEDFLLIERLTLTLGQGLTALTGETGAGKSILLEALGLAAGGRPGRGGVRRGAARGVVAAAFAAHAALGLLALATLALLIAPGLLWRDRASTRVPAAAFAALWGTIIAAALLGPYPTPFVGCGASAILGYFMSAALTSRA